MSSYDAWVKMKVMWYQKCMNSQYLFKKNILSEKFIYLKIKNKY